MRLLLGLLATVMLSACTSTPVNGSAQSVATRRVAIEDAIFTYVPRSTNDASTLPTGVIYAGLDVDGSQLFLCRAAWANGVHPGKTWDRPHATCNIGYGGGEVAVPTFEVPIVRRKFAANEVFWDCVGEGTPGSPHVFNWSRYVVGGHENNGTLGYCLASYSDNDGGLCPEDAKSRLVPGKLLPGPVGSDAPRCYFGLFGQEQQRTVFTYMLYSCCFASQNAATCQGDRPNRPCSAEDVSGYALASKP